MPAASETMQVDESGRKAKLKSKITGNKMAYALLQQDISNVSPIVTLDGQV